MKLEIQLVLCTLLKRLQDTLRGLIPVTIPVHPLYSPFSPSLILPSEQENNGVSSGLLHKGMPLPSSISIL